MGIAEAVPENSAQAECVKAALVAFKECVEVNQRRLEAGGNGFVLLYRGNCWRGGGVLLLLFDDDVAVVAVVDGAVVVVARRACSAPRLSPLILMLRTLGGIFICWWLLIF